MESSRKNVLLLVESSRAFGQLLVKGIVEYAKLHAHWGLYREAAGLEEKNTYRGRSPVDGIIAHVRNAKAAEKIISAGTPAVVKGISEVIPGVCNIVGDTEATGRMAAEHLRSRGFKAFAYCGFKKMLWSEEFGYWFRQALEEEGFPVSLYFQVEAKVRRFWREEIGRLARWLVSLPKPVGVMACNDDRGQHVIEACRLAELRVPHDVAVLGVDDDAWICDLTSPPMTSVALSTQRAGYEAARLLDQLMAGEPTQDQKIVIEPMHVHVRQSTDVLAVEDPVVAAALSLIRARVGNALSVEDVAERTGQSRRLLERRFRKTMACSVYQAIQRVRIERARRLLGETNGSLADIARQCGFSSVPHFRAAFKRQTGLAPRQYRLRIRL